MEIWTYLKAKTKILNDCDLSDEIFVSPNEMSGYFNDALTDTEAEIHALNAENEYFRTKYFIPLVTGTGKYPLPDNIYANKIVGIMYANGSVIYPVVQYRRRYRYQNMIFTDTYGQQDDYRYTLFNDVPGQAQMEIHPVSRETAILPPAGNAFTPMIMWYLRNCSRIPLMVDGSNAAEFCNPEVVAASQVNALVNWITVNSGTTTYGVKSQGIPGCYPGSIPYVTGDQVQVSVGFGGTLPTPLIDGGIYWVIAIDSQHISLAGSLANAQSNTPLTLGGNATGFFQIKVAATQAIVNATLIDIPEFTPYVIQWAKCQTLLKELKAIPKEESDILVEMKKQMIDALTMSIPDDDDEIQPDFSVYQELS